MKIKNVSDIAVLVGRFQTDDLHEGHKALIDSVANTHEKVIIFLGLSPLKCSTNNPLDYEARKKMINRHYPDINILYIKDMFSDQVWSDNLDEQIENIVGPGHTVCLYGGRDSFIQHYSGKFNTTELKQEVFISSSSIRKQLALRSKGTTDFNSGVIWATLNQWPACIPTVDIAILNEEGTEILLGRKQHEDKYRLIGGFVNPGETYEHAAKREVGEETGLETGSLEYVGSFNVDDWRYKREQNKITTTLFKCNKIFGRPSPNDDIYELKWFKFDKTTTSYVVANHKILLEALMNKK